MKKTMHILSVVIILFIMSFLSGCGNSEPVQASLSIQETSWSEQGSSTYDPCGQSIELVSTSMSAGFNLVISYEQK